MILFLPKNLNFSNEQKKCKNLCIINIYKKIQKIMKFLFLILFSNFVHLEILETTEELAKNFKEKELENKFREKKIIFYKAQLL